MDIAFKSAEFSHSSASGSSSTPFDDLAAVHEEHSARIFRFLLFSLRDRDVAQTLTQDTFLHAWRSRASFRGDCSVATWLMRIALNLARDHTRTNSFKFWKRVARTAVSSETLKDELQHHVSSQEDALAAREQLALVWDAVEALPAQQRSVFFLRFVEEMELYDIATAMGSRVPTVKSHLYRAMDRVRNALNSKEVR